MHPPASPAPPSDLPSDRSFGFFFCAIALVGAAYALWKGHVEFSVGGLFVSGLFGLVAAISPHRLRGLNRRWYRLGKLLGRVVGPLVLGFIFYGMVTPIAVAMRLCGRDALRLLRRNVATYWIARETGELDPQTFKNQF